MQTKSGFPFLSGLLIFLTFLSPALFAGEISLESLLREMVDRTAVTRFPEPFYTCRQASSYDRASTAPDKPGWYANADTSQFVRDERNGDRKEWVLLDADGPGAVVRWWITAPHYKATFRIYLDGAAEPAVEANIGDLVGGDFLVSAPLSEETARGRNLYLPIPYAKHIKVTADEMPTQQNLYYQINYRTYTPGTAVETFSREILEKQTGLVRDVQKTLVEPAEVFGSEHAPEEKAPRGIARTGSLRVESKPNPEMTANPADSEWVGTDRFRDKHQHRAATDRPFYISGLKIRVEADDVPQALRSIVLRITFDGKETVCCPLGDFFGSGVGINPYQSWYSSVTKDGEMISRWPMPFRSEMLITLESLKNQKFAVTCHYDLSPYEWDERSMYFHCNWRQQREMETLGGDGTDWNYITIQGKGVFAGDSLSVVNRHTAWWGEGDEKIFVDGETFPSHFGTGTEDYYGYAWCTPAFFESPFHAQPRAEGPDNFGNTTNSRYRLLDGIPFTASFRFDMEVWHWAKTQIDYAVTSYWYALGDATTNPPDNVKKEAAHKVSYKTENYVFLIPGYGIGNKPRGNLSIQNMSNRPGKWHNNEQLWWTGAKPGNDLVLKVKTEHAGKQKLIVSMTKAADYGIMRFWLDGQKVGEPVDLYNDGVIPSGPVELGTVDIVPGDHELKITIEGKNAKSANYFFGMDKYNFVPAE
ncbi:MAG: DUF2961 domain-containing protein [Planctomycetaceae bacterium]|jgi:hypothetical protein|nr:DUF2961 domain-containing protein [Planctomycetaceae bacterium]